MALLPGILEALPWLLGWVNYVIGSPWLGYWNLGNWLITGVFRNTMHAVKVCISCVIMKVCEGRLDGAIVYQETCLLGLP